MNNEWEKQGTDSVLTGDKTGRIVPLKNSARVIPTPIHNNDNVKKYFYLTTIHCLPVTGFVIHLLTAFITII